MPIPEAGDGSSRKGNRRESELKLGGGGAVRGVGKIGKGEP